MPGYSKGLSMACLGREGWLQRGENDVVGDSLRRGVGGRVPPPSKVCIGTCMQNRERERESVKGSLLSLKQSLAVKAAARKESPPPPPPPLVAAEFFAIVRAKERHWQGDRQDERTRRGCCDCVNTGKNRRGRAHLRGLLDRRTGL